VLCCAVLCCAVLCCGSINIRLWTRIGQTKEVKVYRLITSKTYERQMFERTSKKLGLDQAVLDNINITDIANTKTKKETLAQVG
jgi:SNF2 family DNA or RNA helicase